MKRYVSRLLKGVLCEVSEMCTLPIFCMAQRLNDMYLPATLSIVSLDSLIGFQWRFPGPSFQSTAGPLHRYFSISALARTTTRTYFPHDITLSFTTHNSQHPQHNHQLILKPFPSSLALQLLPFTIVMEGNAAYCRLIKVLYTQCLRKAFLEASAASCNGFQWGHFRPFESLGGVE